MSYEHLERAWNDLTQAERDEYLKQQEKESAEYKALIQKVKDKSFKYESQLEDYFARKVKEAGGWAVKFDPAACSGLPDRLVFYGGHVWLIELKLPKGVVSPIQQAMHRRFLKLGHKVKIVRTKDDVTAFIIEMLQRVIEGL